MGRLGDMRTRTVDKGQGSTDSEERGGEGKGRVKWRAGGRGGRRKEEGGLCTWMRHLASADPPLIHHQRRLPSLLSLPSLFLSSFFLLLSEVYFPCTCTFCHCSKGLNFGLVPSVSLSLSLSLLLHLFLYLVPLFRFPYHSNSFFVLRSPLLPLPVF